MNAALVLMVVLAARAAALDLASAKNRPVTKVVTLLKDMQKQLEKEADDDQEIYEQMMCWCTTNNKQKTQAIADGEQRSVDLTAAIEGGTAASARLNVEIKATDDEVAKNNRALEQATSLRKKQAAEFNGDEMDMLQSIGALKSAVTVLGKHHDALLQAKDGAEVLETAADSDELINVMVMLKQTLRKHADMLGEVITPTQKRAILAFAEETGDQKKPEGPQGGEVFGILKNMKETFEANLAAAQRDESDNQGAYNDLKAAKESEIAAGTTLSRMKTNELGSTDEKLANDKQDLEDTQNNLAADRKFLGSLKEKCQMFDNEFEERSKNRQDEIGAVSKAMAILTSDDAHDTFTRTLDGGAASFLQRKSYSSRRNRAVQILVTTAKKLREPKLSAVAITVRLAGFEKVKETLDNMVARLTIEKEDEVQHKDWCNDGIRKNERQTEMQERDKEGLVSKIEDLDNTMSTLTAAINQLKAEVAEAQVQMKRVGEDREAANKEFQVTVADQRATQELLTNALNVLSGYYDTKLVQLKEAGRVQVQQPAGPPPPTGFKKYEKSSVSGGVMGMIKQIVSDAKAMEEEAIADEDAAAAAYQDFVKESNESIASKTRDIMNKSETKAQAEADKGEASVNLEGTLSELKMSANESRDLHSSCDFVLKNFDIRQSARDDEIEALKQSIAILSAATFGFLQKK